MLSTPAADQISAAPDFAAAPVPASELYQLARVAVEALLAKQPISRLRQLVR